MSNDEQIILAQSRIGKQATIKHGLLSGTVTIRAVKQAYGRFLFLVENDRQEREWCNEKTLVFQEDKR